ncbi:hypothetical protein GGS23DRAFT_585564 [Durotheca rogersii]|uniref:uncharacterized protein n=1 Tax=Durotheca rogersii TaxID=419775 RepID=UPI0022200444|nr:uncharacterized protein GGS23DRAFT_585564 [Durotheca rogersii]KAI5859470.1 hypothetical protein GGS23DRAFT_585564 [Durotheca rogersii]
MSNSSTGLPGTQTSYLQMATFLLTILLSWFLNLRRDTQAVTHLYIITEGWKGNNEGEPLTANPTKSAGRASKLVGWEERKEGEPERLTF